MTSEKESPEKESRSKKGPLALLLVAAVAVAVVQPWGDDDSGEEAAETAPAPAPSDEGEGKASGKKCSLAPGSQITMTLPGCEELISDTAAEEDPASLWGELSCVEEVRHQRIPRGGDSQPQATGAPQSDKAFRRIRVIDGDDYFGERCELGYNDRSEGPTVFYEEGDRRVTFLSVRLPKSFPLNDEVFQVVMQMKQTQPADNGDGTPVLALEAFDKDWILRQSDSSGPSSDAHELWSAPAKPGVWTRFALDVTYSQDPTRGRIRIYADLNGDGDFTDPRERSSVRTTYTLKVETEDGEDDLAAGESIPSHLRVGLYHDPAYRCPPPDGCYVDLDNVQVIAP